MTHTPKTCDDCHVTWDRKYNVKDIVLCPLHKSAPALLEALEDALPLLNAAWRRAIMDTPDAPMAAKLAKIEEGSPEATLARDAIKQAKP